MTPGSAGGPMAGAGSFPQAMVDRGPVYDSKRKKRKKKKKK